MKPLDPQIDEAIKSMPLAPLPIGFIKRTMAQLSPHAIRYRLEFIDLAIPTFVMLFLSITTALGYFGYRMMPPLAQLKMQASLNNLLFELSIIPATTLLFGTLVIGFLGLLITMIIMLTVDRAIPTLRQ